MEIAIVVYDGFDQLDAIGPFEVFSHAKTLGADVSVTLCSVDEVDWVASSHNLRVGVDANLSDVSPDMVLVPGGPWSRRASRGALVEADRGTLPDVIAGLYDDEVSILGVCTGGMILGRSGILTDRPAVTHASVLDELSEMGAEVIDARVVDDGDILTAGGVTSGLDLALHVVEREFGDELASNVSQLIEYEPQGTVYEVT